MRLPCVQRQVLSVLRKLYANPERSAKKVAEGRVPGVGRTDCMVFGFEARNSFIPLNPEIVEGPKSGNQQ